GTTLNAATLDFADAVTLGTDTTIQGAAGPPAAAAASVKFEKTVDSDATAARSLTVNSALTELDGVVGGAKPLSSLKTIDEAGATTLKGGTLNAATVDFADAVTLGADMTIQGAAG